MPLHVFLLQLEQYKQLKELIRKQGAVVTQQAEKLHWEVRADHEKLAFDLRRKKEVEVKLDIYLCWHNTSFNSLIYRDLTTV